MQVQFKTKLGDFEKTIILYPFILWLTVFIPLAENKHLLSGLS